MASLQADLGRLLTDSYLSGIESKSLDDIRALRAECQDAEVALSYLRRLAQGRLDIVNAYLVRTDRTDHDVNGNPTQYTKSVGSGRVVLFRGGRRILGIWSRPTIDAPTTLVDAAGKPLLFAPGGTFVALARPGAPA